MEGRQRHSRPRTYGHFFTNQPQLQANSVLCPRLWETWSYTWQISKIIEWILESDNPELCFRSTSGFYEMQRYWGIRLSIFNRKIDVVQIRWNMNYFEDLSVTPRQLYKKRLRRKEGLHEAAKFTHVTTDITCRYAWVFLGFHEVYKTSVFSHGKRTKPSTCCLLCVNLLNWTEKHYISCRVPQEVWARSKTSLNFSLILLTVRWLAPVDGHFIASQLLDLACFRKPSYAECWWQTCIQTRSNSTCEFCRRI